MYEEINSELEKRFVISEFPLNIAIDVTSNCNLNCRMCAHDKLTRAKGFMSMSLYKKIIDEIAQENKGTRIWLDAYGEPLLAGWKLYYMIDYAKKKGLYNVCMNTNGTLLKKEYADMLLDSGIDFISLDCDGFSKEVYEKIRINGDRDVFYQNAEYLLEEKKRRNSNVVIDVTRIYIPEIGKFIKVGDEIETLITGDNKGELICISEDESIATCRIDGDKLVVNALSVGSVNIRVKNRMSYKNGLYDCGEALFLAVVQE